MQFVYNNVDVEVTVKKHRYEIYFCRVKCNNCADGDTCGFKKK